MLSRTIRPALRSTLARRSMGVSIHDNVQTGHNETYSRDPSSGIAFNSLGQSVSLSDAEIQKWYPDQHHKIHMTIAKHHDHVGISYTGTYAWTTNVFMSICIAFGLIFGFNGLKNSYTGVLD